MTHHYKAPGVYVEEVPSAVKPIAGVGTSTAGFVGVFGGKCILDEVVAHADSTTKQFNLLNQAVVGTAWKVCVGKTNYLGDVGTKSSEGITVDGNQVEFDVAPDSKRITISYSYQEGENKTAAVDEEIGFADNATKVFPKADSSNLEHTPAQNTDWSIKIGEQEFDRGTVGGTSPNNTTISGGKVTFTEAPKSDPISISYCAESTPDRFTVVYKEMSETLKAQRDNQANFVLQVPRILDISCKDCNSTGLTFQNDVPKKGQVRVTLAPPLAKRDHTMVVTYKPVFETVQANQATLCTNFGEFKSSFGDFSLCPSHNRLVHAVYGFFNNGGTRCYVVWVKSASDVAEALKQFEAIDEIAIVAIPGIVDRGARDAVVTHCAQKMQDRFAIFDGTGDFDPNAPAYVPSDSDYSAFYVPWIQVADPATDSKIYVPPSGHIAGIYARVDSARGVHKAPANEVVLGALGLKCLISKAQQDGLNPQGINCIRELRGNIKVWGARTIGGDANNEFKYVNVRRLLLYLRKSIDQGTQWVVFEPNDPSLWAKITRNITAFLTNVWRSGALFGSTPQEAFYVKCDAENNPPEERDLGKVVTEIGVAVTKPAEFVIFRLSQWAGPQG